MKKTALILIFTFPFLFAYSQSISDIAGDWYTQDKNAVVTITVEGNTVVGTTTWMKEPNDDSGNPKLDKLNPDEKLRNRARMGLRIMEGFVYNGDNVWEDGTIYKPDAGKIYGGTATLVDQKTLKLKGYLLSLPFIGKTSTWTRKTK